VVGSLRDSSCLSVLGDAGVMTRSAWTRPSVGWPATAGPLRRRWRSRPLTARSWTAAGCWAQVRSRRQLEARRPAVHRRPPTTRLGSLVAAPLTCKPCRRCTTITRGPDRGSQPAWCPTGRPRSGARPPSPTTAATPPGRPRSTASLPPEKQVTRARVREQRLATTAVLGCATRQRRRRAARDARLSSDVLMHRRCWTA
jgi:hypothetical protein